MPRWRNDKLWTVSQTAILKLKSPFPIAEPGSERRSIGKFFAPFVTTKPNGVGLGLGICRRIAESHRGKLSGFNRVTGGAQFQLTLPIAGMVPADTSQSKIAEEHHAKPVSHR